MSSLSLSFGACRVAAALCVAAASTVASFALDAFPGAEGFGKNARGARAAGTPTVYHVTNLNDSGAGSFRDAVSQPNRIVVFDVGGVINLTGSAIVAAQNITIAGQTAPGGGITVYGNRISFSGANDSICRYMRFRMGINGEKGADTVGIANGTNMIFDHVSASWGRDETFSISGETELKPINNITLQDCLIGQGLLTHSAGGLIQTNGGVAILRTLYADNWMRNPKVKGVNNYINNVVYNWGSGGGYIPAGDSAGDTFANMVGCYFIGGPNSGIGTSPFKTGNLNYRLYHLGNYQDLDLDGTLNGTLVDDTSFPTLQIVGTRFNYASPLVELNAQQALAYVLANAGASHKRDNVDAYMVNETLSYGTIGAQIFNESEMGGLAPVAAGLKELDTDIDGMPDWWEEAAGTNKSVDDATTLAADGYTNIEHYLNALVVGGVPGATITGITNDTGSSATDGITSDTTLVLNGTALEAGASVQISRADLGVIGTVTADGAGNWSFDYTGTPLADRNYVFFATATLSGGRVTPPSKGFRVLIDTVPAGTSTITGLTTTPSYSFAGTSVPGDFVTIYLSGSPVGTATADALGNWTAAYTGAPLAPGVYSFTAIASDLAGNTGAESAPYLVDTSIAPPVFTGISTDSGASASDQYTNDTTLIFAGTAPASSTVAITRAGVGIIGTPTADGAGVWSFDYTGTVLAAGPHTFTATASNGGSASPVSLPFTVTIDTALPTVSSIKRSIPASYSSNGGTLVYRVTFSEPVSGVDQTDFSLTVSGASGTISGFSAINSTTYDVTVTGATGDGTIRVDLKSSGTGIVDVAGNAISGGYTAGQTYTIRLAGSGVWISTESGDVWSDSLSWDAGLVAEGTGATADFSLVDLTANNSVVMDAPHTLGRLVFGDLDFSTTAQWTITNGGNAANTLTFSGPPAIIVNGATTPTGDTADVPAANAYPAHLDVVVNGSGGVTKTGVGTIEINKPFNVSGALTVTKGIFQVGPGGSYSPTGVTLATSQQLRITGGTFSTGTVDYKNSGTGTRVQVSGGTATFGKIASSDNRNGVFAVSGGTVAVGEIDFPRSADSESALTNTGVIITGGDTTAGTIGLGTDDSWGALWLSGGTITVTGVFNNGYQVTAARGGVINVSGGEFNATDTTYGLVMSRYRELLKSGTLRTNANNVSKLLITGGKTNLARLTFGYDALSTAGSGTVSVTNGELNLGSGGIVKNGTAGMTSTITLNSGILGAMADWSTTHPIVIAGAPATLQLRAADKTNAPFNFTLSGALTGAGGFTKTGGGKLTLGGTNTLAGPIEVSAGMLAVTGSVTVSPVILNSGGTLANTGTFGAVLGLTWNGGGKLAADLGAVSPMTITGPLTKGSAGAYTLALSSAATPTTGTSYTLANFGSTTFTAGDFTVTGNSGYLGVPIVNATNLQFRVTGVGASAEFTNWAYLAGLVAPNDGALADPDGDGVNNLLEFVLGRDPLNGDASGLTPLVVNDSGTDYPGVTFTRRQVLGGVTTSVDACADLAWVSLLGTVTQSVTPNGNGTETVVVRSTTPLSAQPRQFFRLQATLP